MKVFYISLLLLFIVLETSAQTVGLIQHDSGTLDDGYVLFSPISSTTTYLIDKCGKQIKTWPSTYRPGQAAYILSEGTLLRTGNANNTTFNAGGRGGIIQKIDWNGNPTWTYTISDATQCQHHDIKALPNGNILAIVWESKTNAEAIAQGRNPSLVPTTVWSEKIIEIQPVGTNSGNIVWEWHLWDHLVQDFDSSKPNFGTVAASPQLINVNYNASATSTDWIHLNSVDYNPTLDQIILSSHEFDEVWIIDHSTTTSQAATHAGGNSGKGGDILYRWGNPRAYNNGTVSDQKLFGQHNAYWIESGFPFQNQVMLFNNGNGRTGGNYSTVEIINPPTAGFNYTSTLPFGPISTSWIYNSGNPNAIYSANISGSQQLSNGNVLMCDGPIGTFREVNSLGITLWKYINPVNNSGIINQNDSPTQNIVFRCSFYPSNYSGFSGRILTAGTTIENSNTVSNSCNLNLSISENELIDKIKLYPNPASDFFIVDYPNSSGFTIQIFNSLGQKVQEKKTIDNKTQISISNYDKGFYLVKINDGKNITTQKIIID